MKTTTLPARPREVRDRVSDVLGYARSPLDPFFNPRSVAVIGATEKAGSVGRTVFWNLISSPFGGTVYPVNPNRPSASSASRPTRASPTSPSRSSSPSSSPRRRSVPAIDGRVRRGRRQGRRSSSPPASRRSARRAPSWSSADPGARRGPAGIRVIGPNCLGVMSPVDRPQRHLRRRDRQARHGRLHQPERGAADRGPRLERARGASASARSSPSARCSTWAGATSSTYLGDDPNDPEHRHLHGDDRRRAGLPVGRPRGRPDQADHRHQARPDGPGGQGRRLAHRLADRQRRGPRGGLPAGRRPPRGPDRGPVRRWPRSWPSSRGRAARG